MAELRGDVVGHSIVRVDRDEGGPVGLFSTTWVAPEQRRAGIADALVARGEQWLRAQGMTAAVTDTAVGNEKLVGLFQRRGYSVVLTEGEMLRLRGPL